MITEPTHPLGLRSCAAMNRRKDIEASLEEWGW
jgi:hypothetical protein